LRNFRQSAAGGTQRDAFHSIDKTGRAAAVGIRRYRRVRRVVARHLDHPLLFIMETTMKAKFIWAAAVLAVAALSWAPAQAADSQSRPGWCANSGYDDGPPRDRGPGTGPFWSGEPTDCRSIRRNGRYRGTDPDPNIRLQLMRRN
jgi:hypothetical protein